MSHLKVTDQKAEGSRGDHWRDFWMCGAGTGQQVVQLHVS